MWGSRASSWGSPLPNNSNEGSPFRRTSADSSPFLSPFPPQGPPGSFQAQTHRMARPLYSTPTHPKRLSSQDNPYGATSTPVLYPSSSPQQHSISNSSDPSPRFTPGLDSERGFIHSRKRGNPNERFGNDPSFSPRANSHSPQIHASNNNRYSPRIHHNTYSPRNPSPNTYSPRNPSRNTYSPRISSSNTYSPRNSSQKNYLPRSNYSNRSFSYQSPRGNKFEEHLFFSEEMLQDPWTEITMRLSTLSSGKSLGQLGNDSSSYCADDSLYDPIRNANLQPPKLGSLTPGFGFFGCIDFPTSNYDSDHEETGSQPDEGDDMDDLFDLPAAPENMAGLENSASSPTVRSEGFKSPSHPGDSSPVKSASPKSSVTQHVPSINGSSATQQMPDSSDISLRAQINASVNPECLPPSPTISVDQSLDSTNSLPATTQDTESCFTEQMESGSSITNHVEAKEDSLGAPPEPKKVKSDDIMVEASELSQKDSETNSLKDEKSLLCENEKSCIVNEQPIPIDHSQKQNVLDDLSPSFSGAVDAALPLDAEPDSIQCTD